MICGCGAEFEVVEHDGGLSLRCKNYLSHKCDSQKCETYSDFLDGMIKENEK